MDQPFGAGGSEFVGAIGDRFECVDHEVMFGDRDPAASGHARITGADHECGLAGTEHAHGESAANTRVLGEFVGSDAAGRQFFGQIRSHRSDREPWQGDHRLGSERSVRLEDLLLTLVDLDVNVGESSGEPVDAHRWHDPSFGTDRLGVIGRTTHRWQTRLVLFAQDISPTEVLPSPDTFAEWSVGAAVLLVGFLVLHKLVSLTVRSFLHKPSLSRTVLVATRAPIRVMLIGTVLLFWIRHSSLAEETEATLVHAARLIVIVGFGFLFIRLIGVSADALVAKLPLDESDNLRSRRAQTQLSVLRRVGTVAIVILTAGVCLWTFPEVRALGTSILASAGLIGILAGVAARSSFGNLMAGIQIAFAEPIRLDDVVVVEGEYGTVEEITLTYVVVKSWDQRRLVIPSAYFVENRFENWTKSTSELIGAASIFLDLTADVEAFRTEALRFVGVRPEWNGDVVAVHVVDTDRHDMKVRVLASANDSALTFELRAAIREHMLHWLRENRPYDLAKVRGELVDDASDRPDSTDQISGGRSTADQDESGIEQTWYSD